MSCSAGRRVWFESGKYDVKIIGKFIVDTGSILSKIGVRLLGGELSLQYQEFVKEYKDDLLSLSIKGAPHDQL